jgi:hypothetical protein
VIRDVDAAVRLRAFEFLTEQRRRFGEGSIPRAVLDAASTLTACASP